MRQNVGAAFAGMLLVLTAGCGNTPERSAATGRSPAATSPSPAPAATGPATSAPSHCEFPPFSEVRPVWRLKARDFQMRRYLESVLTNRYGPVTNDDLTKTEPGPRLEHGLIGFTMDAEAQEFVAVVDPGLIDVSELDAVLKRAARAKEDELKPGPHIKVRAQAGCHTAAEMREAFDVLREVDRKYPRTLSAFTGAPESAAYRVWVPPGSPAATELRERLGDRVIVREAVIRAG